MIRFSLSFCSDNLKSVPETAFSLYCSNVRPEILQIISRDQMNKGIFAHIGFCPQTTEHLHKSR